MKIGFDISQTGGKKAGCGYFADNLICNLAKIDTRNQYILYPTFGDHYWDNPYEVRYIKSPNFSQGLKHSSPNMAKHFWQNPPANIETRLGSPDIVHANNFFCPQKFENTKLIYTLYDINFIDHPEWTTEANRVACFEGVFNASIYADFIISISEYSKQHFLDIFPNFNPKNIAVIHPASRFSYVDDFPRPKHLDFLTTNNFWLSVGTIEPRKNHKNLLLAYKKLKNKHKKIKPLVLAGGKGWLVNDLENFIKDLDLAEDVKLLGYVNNKTLQWLYQNCFCFVYPSLFEGFGLPVLEAMSLKAPVIASDSSSIPEITKSAAILTNPYKEDDICEAMSQITTNLDYYNELKHKGFERSKAFSWQSTAQKTLSTYKDLLK